MEMMDMGTKRGGEMAMTTKAPAVSYPELHINKDIGDYKVGQSVSLMGEGVVTSVRKDRYGYSLSIEVRKLACSKAAEEKKVGSKLADDYLNKK